MLQRLQEVSIEQLGVFQSTQRLQFDAGTPDLHLIVGANETGKTTLLNVIKIGLFGELPDTHYPLVSAQPPDSLEDLPRSGRVSLDIETDTGFIRLDRRVTAQETDGQIREAVGVEQRATTTESDDSQPGATEELIPPAAAELVFNDGTVQHGKGSWDAYLEHLLTTAVNCRSDVTLVTGLWDEYRQTLQPYIDRIGPTPRYQVQLSDQPGSIQILSETPGQSSDAPANMASGQRIQLTQALRLAAGECAQVPQLFDMPFGRLSNQNIDRMISGFRHAARSRQIILFSHTASGERLADQEFTTATTYWLERDGDRVEVDRKHLDMFK